MFQYIFCVYLSQEECINAICEKVFQKFPEFVKRCKDAAFEAMSDPMYSGKMRVGLIHKHTYTQTDQGPEFLITNISSFQDLKKWKCILQNVMWFLSGPTEIAETLSSEKGQSFIVLTVNQGRLLESNGNSEFLW